MILTKWQHITMTQVEKIFLTKDVVYVWVTIVAKHGNLELLKRIYVGPGSCDDIDFSSLREMGAPIEINCLEKKYRVIGGAFFRREAIIKCEPPEEFVKWMDIPSKSAVEKLSKIICPKLQRHRSLPQTPLVKILISERSGKGLKYLLDKFSI
jgi:hypothetical protein